MYSVLWRHETWWLRFLWSATCCRFAALSLSLFVTRAVLAAFPFVFSRHSLCTVWAIFNQRLELPWFKCKERFLPSCFLASVINLWVAVSDSRAIPLMQNRFNTVRLKKWMCCNVRKYFYKKNNGRHSEIPVQVNTTLLIITWLFTQ